MDDRFDALASCRLLEGLRVHDGGGGDGGGVVGTLMLALETKH